MRTTTLVKKALFAKSGETFAEVNLPHTWNNLDGQDGGSDYWRGTASHQIDLPAPTAGKRQYIQFEGANHIATVSCNGKVLGTHKGGFSTFRFELTDAMKGSGNVLEVEVSNPVCDVYPQMADFTFYGGLYRNVTYLEEEGAHFDLLKDGTSGVFVTPNPVGKTRLDLFPVSAEGCSVCVTLFDADGGKVISRSADAQAHTVLTLDVKEPHLWDGVRDPYCYTAVATLEKDGTVLDEVTVTYGDRSFHVDVNTGFYLNGKSMPLRGVSRRWHELHQQPAESDPQGIIPAYGKLYPALRGWVLVFAPKTFSATFSPCGGQAQKVSTVHLTRWAESCIIFLNSIFSV